MIRYLLALIALAFSTPAFADQIRIAGVDPTPTITVKYGDTLVTNKPLVETVAADGTLTRRYGVWIDRVSGKGFQIDGATKLRLDGFVTGTGYVYSLVDAVPPPAAPTVLFGANLSGAEAAQGDAVRPGLDDFKGYIDYYGFKLIRYPFKDVRMTAARIAELKVNIDYAISKNVPVILDNHTYKWLTPDEFVAFWVPFMANFPQTDLIMIDLVNEPQGFNDAVLTNDWDQWARDTNETIAKLRAQGITNPILIEYPQWSATFRFDKNEATWKASESAGTALDRVGGLKDPLNKTYINGHRYFDRGSSGTNKECEAQTSGFVEFAAQLRKRNLKAYITESAFGSSYGINASCVAAGNEAVTALKANSDVLKGITWWGGGRVWPESYLFKIDAAKATRYQVPLNPYLVQLKGE